MLVPGMLLSERYEIQEQIGIGGMAEVYKATDTRLNRSVAVKVLKSEFSDDKSFIGRFKNEAMSAAGLSHPNIVGVYDVGEDQGYHYIIMELVEGITLKKFIEKKTRLEVREAVGIAIQICQGMEAAHNNHIIHRDIKPQNIMISRDGKVKVADFGIAKLVSSDTFTQTAVGSAHYLSPEQARGGYSDERSDIYSLGVTLYEMLTGQLPFGGESEVTVALQHIQNEARPAKELVPSIPFSLDKVVQKCMQKHPENRYNSASELILDLKHCITNPDGDFVKINKASDGATRKFTVEEIDEIKTRSAAKTGPVSIVPEEDYEPVRNEAPAKKENRERKEREAKNKRLREELEELDTVDSRFEMVIIIITVLFALALAGGLFYVAVRFFGIPVFSGEAEPTPTPYVQEAPSGTPTPTPVGVISMPNVVGLSFDDAVASLRARSEAFSILEDERIYSTQEEGTVLKQYPPYSTEILLNQVIKLTVSAGPEPIPIPKLIGLLSEEGERQLTNLGLKVVIQTEASEVVDAGKIIRTEPIAQQIRYAGDTVIIYVSNGAPVTYTQVPGLIGKTEPVAAELLEQAGLILNEVTYSYSNEFVYGMIMEQSEKPGDTIASNTKVNIVISQGDWPAEITPTPVPNGTYYDLTYDTTGLSNRVVFDENDEVEFVFALYQEGVGEVYITVDYGKDLYEQYIKRNRETFEQLYHLRIYSNMEAYKNFKEGPALLILYAKDPTFMEYMETDTKTVFLEALGEKTDTEEPSEDVNNDEPNNESTETPEQNELPADEPVADENNTVPAEPDNGTEGDVTPDSTTGETSEGQNN